MKRAFWLIGLVVLGGGLFAFAGILPTSENTTTFAVPGQEGMHRELIPANITIVHCSYELDVVAPGTTFRFDVVGSGFNDAFYKIISMDADAMDVTIKNLTLVTANQIQGQIEVGSEATTQYIRPLVYIKSLPIFRAPDPVGVVRPGEVLDIELVSINESGQWGKFRVTTNLNEALYKKFRLVPTDSSLEISNVKPAYPFFVNGVMMIGQGLKHGQYGVIAYLGDREIYKESPLVDVVKPNVGKTGTIDKVSAADKAHRPGDMVDLIITGSAFPADIASSLSLKVSPLAMPEATITYVSAGLLQASIKVPPQTQVGIYDVTVLGNNKVLHEQKGVFGIVPPNWLGSLKTVGALTPGKNGQISITGRDITHAFVSQLRLRADADGLQLGALRWHSPTALVADVTVDASTAPGDYIIHVYDKNKELKIPRGNIIKITP